MNFYPLPEENPKCICPTFIAQMFCIWGHLTKCHYPMTCDEARCSHYLAQLADDDDDAYEPISLDDYEDPTNEDEHDDNLLDPLVLYNYDDEANDYNDDDTENP